MTKKRNAWLDIYKVFVAFLVLCGHFCYHPYIAPLFRIGVATFFMIGGYFLFKEEKEKALASVKKSIKRVLLYILIAFVIYFTYNVILFSVKGGLKEYLQSFIKFNYLKNLLLYNYLPIYKNAGHLWFLVAYLADLIIMYFFIKFNIIKVYKYLIPFGIVWLFVMEILHKSNYIDVSLYAYLNGYVFGLPFVGLGYYLHKAVKDNKLNLNNKKLRYTCLGLGIFFFFFQIVESLWLFKREIYVSSAISAILLLIFFLGCNSSDKLTNWFYKYIGKESYLFIYIIHILVRNVYKMILPYIKVCGNFVYILFNNAITLFLIVCFIYLIGRFVIISIKKLCLKNKSKLG